MIIPALTLAILGAATQGNASSDAPIVVSGHNWAPFISPMGEPFRAHAVTEDTLANWFGQADRDRDGVLTSEEMQTDAERFFATLDSDGDGRIGPQELIDYEWEIAPDVQVSTRARRAPGDTTPLAKSKGSRHKDGGLEGGARYSLLNFPEPVAAADSNLDRDIMLGEFKQAARYRFQLLDSDGSGRLTFAMLDQRRANVRKAATKHKYRKDERDSRIATPVN